MQLLYNYPSKGTWIVVDIYRDAKRRGIYPPLFTDPQGDSFFSIYQIRWIKQCCFNFLFWNFRKMTRHFSLRSQNSEYPRIFGVTGADQNAWKLLSTDLVNTKSNYYVLKWILELNAYYSVGRTRHTLWLVKNPCFILRNRKHFPCFCWVVETQVEVWQNEKCCANVSRRRVFPQLFQVLPNLHECFYNSIETSRIYFLFVLENSPRKITENEENFIVLSSKHRFSTPRNLYLITLSTN